MRGWRSTEMLMLSSEKKKLEPNRHSIAWYWIWISFIITSTKINISYKIDATLPLYFLQRCLSIRYSIRWFLGVEDEGIPSAATEKKRQQSVWDLWWRLTHQHPSTTGIELDYGWNHMEKWWMLWNIMVLYNRDILDLNQWKRNNME